MKIFGRKNYARQKIKKSAPVLISTRLKEYFYPSHTSYRLKLIVKEIIDSLRGKTVLDIGMGSGWLMRDLYNAGFVPTGVDISNSSLKEAKYIFRQEKMPLKVFKASAEKLPFTARSYSNIIMFSVLEHIQRPAPSLKEVRRILKKNGVLIVVVPNPGTYGLVYDKIIPRVSKKLELLNTIRLNNDYRKFSLPLNRSLLHNDFHTFRYNSFSLQKTIENAGFSIVSIQNSGFISHFIASFFCGILGFSRTRLKWVEFIDLRLARMLPLRLGIGWLIIARKSD